MPLTATTTIQVVYGFSRKRVYSTLGRIGRTTAVMTRNLAKVVISSAGTFRDISSSHCFMCTSRTTSTVTAMASQYSRTPTTAPMM